MTVGLVADATNPAYTSYEDAARSGLNACAADERSRVELRDPGSTNDPEGQAVLFATENTDAVIAVGAPLLEPIARAARRFDGTHFTIVDAAVTLPNVESMLFDEREGGLLAGAVAALASKTRDIAFIGGGADAHVRAYERGFRDGAARVDPAVRVRAVTLQSFTDGAAAGAAARRLLAAGSDALFAVAGSADTDVISSARSARAVIVTDRTDADASIAFGSVDKDIAYAAKRACEEAVSQKSPTGTIVLGVAEGALSLKLSDELQRRIGPAGTVKLNALTASLAKTKSGSADR